MKQWNRLRLLILGCTAVASIGDLNAQTGYTQADVDELMYAAGMAQSDGLKEFLKDRLNINLSYIGQVVRGLKESTADDITDAQKAYIAGAQIGLQAIQENFPAITHSLFGNKELNEAAKKHFKEKYVAGFIDGVNHKGQFTENQASIISEQNAAKLKKQNANGGLTGTNTALQQTADDYFYAVGLLYTKGLEEYVRDKMGINTSYLSQFSNGIKEATLAEQSASRKAYLSGCQIGQQIITQMLPAFQQEVFVNQTLTDSQKKQQKEFFMQGFLDGVNGTGRYSPTRASEVAMEKMKAVKAVGDNDNKTRGELFLAQNRNKPGIHVLPSGVQYKVLQAGNGRKPTSTSKVRVHYEGKTIYGEVFDSSYNRGEAMEFIANQVVRGLTEALTNMPAGSIWEVYIPQELGFGDRTTGKIEPFSTLIFKIELLSFTQ